MRAGTFVCFIRFQVRWLSLTSPRVPWEPELLPSPYGFISWLTLEEGGRGGAPGELEVGELRSLAEGTGL